MRNIVMILSDQHAGMALGYKNRAVLTPNIDQLLKTSQVFENAYCNNPLCVPSRMSFLAGKRSDELGIYDNDSFLDSKAVTIADKMNELGYRTILIGRMHFKGEDQFHGFQERYVGDITTQWWGQTRDDLGDFSGTMKVSGCLKEVGYGDSPVQAFDKAVINKTIELLNQKHREPIFLVVGLYGPHFPYCVLKEYFDKIPDEEMGLENYDDLCETVYSDMQMFADRETLYNVRKAYYGLVGLLDEYVGIIHSLVRKNMPDCVFIYTSDHGEQIGHRKLFGKRTMYQDSVKIPLIIEDLNLPGKKYEKAVDLISLHNTILRYGGSVCESIYETDKPVRISSLIERENQEIMLQAVIKDDYKLVKTDRISLYDIKADSKEETDISEENLEMFKLLQGYLFDDREIMKKRIKYRKQIECLKRISKDKEDTSRFKIPVESTRKPRRRQYE